MNGGKTKEAVDEAQRVVEKERGRERHGLRSFVCGRERRVDEGRGEAWLLFCVCGTE